MSEGWSFQDAERRRLAMQDRQDGTTYAVRRMDGAPSSQPTYCVVSLGPPREGTVRATVLKVVECDYGILRDEATGRRLFFRASDCPAFARLRVGDAVSCAVVPGEPLERAVQVQVVT
jgi:hypothetical protein